MSTLNTHFKKICKNAGIRPTTYVKKKSNGKQTTVNTSDVHTYQLRHLYASLGVLLKAEPKALQKLLGHAKITTTYDIYAEAEQSLQQQTAETIDEFITYLTFDGTSEDMETLFKNIQELDLSTLEEKNVKIFKQELIRLANIPKLEEQVKDIILQLSNAEQPTSAVGVVKYINQDNQSRLSLIYSLVSTLELFKTQTQNIKRNTGYNNDYDYTFNYLQTTQNLIQIIHKAIEYEPNEHTQQIQAI